MAALKRLRHAHHRACRTPLCWTPLPHQRRSVPTLRTLAVVFQAGVPQCARPKIYLMPRLDPRPLDAMKRRGGAPAACDVPSILGVPTGSDPHRPSYGPLPKSMDIALTLAIHGVPESDRRAGSGKCSGPGAIGVSSILPRAAGDEESCE